MDKYDKMAAMFCDAVYCITGKVDGDGRTRNRLAANLRGLDEPEPVKEPCDRDAVIEECERALYRVVAPHDDSYIGRRDAAAAIRSLKSKGGGE